MTDLVMTIVFIVVGTFVMIGLFLLAGKADKAIHKLWTKRDYGEKLDYGDDIYGPSLMDVDALTRPKTAPALCPRCHNNHEPHCPKKRT